MSHLEQILNEYKSLNLGDVQNFDRFNELLLIHSSSAMEGSTLTSEETEMLIEENVTPKGKPLEHSLMIKDHHEALKYIIEQSKDLSQISESIIKKIASLVMRSTGGEYSSALGTIDSRLGEYRKSASRAAGGSYYVSHEKIESMMADLISMVNASLGKISSIPDIMTLSSYAHLQLLTIHPFVDGNGRSARLLQNLILQMYEMPLLIIRHQQKTDYIEAIKKARAEEDVEPFKNFIVQEYSHHLKLETERAKAMQKGNSKGISFAINL